VERVRGAFIAVTTTRKPSGAMDYVQVVGVERDQRPRVPWTMVRGLPADLEGPDRVAVDEHDLGKLQLPADPVGAPLAVGAGTARVVALSRGIRSFALYPYVFAEIDTARRLTGAGAGQSPYWVVDLASPACVGAFVEGIRGRPGLEALATADFAARTESFWVFGSGAGGALLFCAVFSLLVGSVIVAQTLYSITREREKELATLKAMGATPRELIGFVAAQAGLIALVGGALGSALAVSLQSLLSSQGIAVHLSAAVFALGGLAVASMCALASVPSVRRVLRVEAAEVFR
jgi:putative ABC transport system permease protein